jgi:transmembrane sensor
MKHPDPIEEAAAEWFVRRRDGLSPEVEARYQSWLAADPRHAAAIAECAEAWRTVNYPVSTGRGPEAIRVLDRRSAVRQRRRRLVATTGLAAAAVLVVTFSTRKTEPPATTSSAPISQRLRIEKFPDGSMAELAAEADIQVDFTTSVRKVRLMKGVAHFHVAKNTARPFVVTAGDVTVRAVGTEFLVRLVSQEVGVLVTEGRVSIERSESSAGSSTPPDVTPVLLDAGRGVVVALGSVAPIQKMTHQQVVSAFGWRGKRVEFSRMPLSDVVTIFNRQNTLELAIGDEATAALLISGVFWADDPEAFARLLESGMGVRLERTGDKVLLTKR